MEGSPKIKRMKLAIQEFDFDIGHVDRELNTVADSFSKLCAVVEDEDEELVVLANMDTPIPSEWLEVLRLAHNSFVGHFGVEKTIQKLEALGQSWKYRREHVRKFIRECPVCQKMSDIKIQIKTHPFTTSSYYPFEVLMMDSIGPLPVDSTGMKYILVIICCFSRYVMLVPTPDTTAISAARALLAFTSRFGIPAKIRLRSRSTICQRSYI
jgi:hypothetical protein